MPLPRLSDLALGWLWPGSRPQLRPRAIAALFTAAEGAPGASWPPMATCGLLRAASHRRAPPAPGQGGTANPCAQQECTQHKRAREQRARVRGGLGCGPVRTGNQEVVRDVDVDVGEDRAQRVHLQVELGARSLDQEKLGYLPRGAQRAGRELELSPRQATDIRLVI